MSWLTTGKVHLQPPAAGALQLPRKCLWSQHAQQMSFSPPCRKCGSVSVTCVSYSPDKQQSTSDSSVQSSNENHTLKRKARDEDTSPPSTSPPSTSPAPSPDASHDSHDAHDTTHDTTDSGLQVKATASVAGGLLFVCVGGFLLRDQINTFVDYFVSVVELYGPWGYLAYGGVYMLLELLAVPAIPLTMTAGAIFGVIPGTIVVIVSATLAAIIAFLLARYVARGKVAEIAARNPRFGAIDAAIGRQGLKVVTLLRMSPLLPLAASNYLYGLTSVELLPYTLGSFIGMLPGTFAYVACGSYGRVLLDTTGEGGASVPTWQMLVGIGVTVVAVSYVGLLAKDALAEIDSKQSE